MSDNKIMKTLNGYEICDEKARQNKVDLPLDSYGNVNHGNDGQVLISKGNGKTEWKNQSDINNGGGGSGQDGLSAYEIAVKNGFRGSEEEWLESLQGKDGSDGTDGVDGFSPIANVTQTASGSTISIQDKNGTTTATVKNGKDGEDGKDGYTPVKGVDYFDGQDGAKGDKGDKGEKGEQGIQGIQGEKGSDGKDGTDGADGIGITSVVQTTTSDADNGENIVTVTLTNGQTTTFTVKNGSKGSQGIQGVQGEKGIQGEKGDKGDVGAQGVAGKDGKDGISVTKTEINNKGELVITLSDNTVSNLGVVIGAKGEKGDKGDTGEQGEQGVSGVYVGSGDMPDDCNVQIDLDGEVLDVVTKEELSQLSLQVANQDVEISNITDGYVVAQNVVNTFEERLTNLETIDSTLPTVSSVDEMTDTTQKYILESTGTIWEYKETTTEIDDTDRNLFNIDEVTINVNPDGTERLGVMLTGLIPVDLSHSDPYVIKFTHPLVHNVYNGSTYPRLYKMSVYTEDGTCLNQFYYNIGANSCHGVLNDNTFEWNVGYYTESEKLTYYDTIKYVKFMIYVKSSTITESDILDDIVITTPEPKTKTITESGWVDTGVVGESNSYNIGAIALQVNENKENIANHNNRLALVEKVITEDSSIPLIPDYWKTAVDALEDKIETLQNNSGKDAFQFIWFSDVHGTEGYTNSNGIAVGKSETTYIGAIARYVMDKFNIPIVICSGDIMSQSSHTSEEKVWNEYEGIKTILSPLKADELLSIKGNHDGAWGEAVTIGDASVYYLRNIGTKKVYNAVYRRQAKDRTRVFGGDGTYYYVDIHGMRIFMLNAHTDGDGSNDENGYAVYNPFKNSVYGQEQLDWLCDSLSTMKDGMKAIIVSHPQIALSHDGNILSGIITAFNNKTSYSGNITISADYWGTDSKYTDISINADFTSTNGKVLAYMHGHNHKDIIDTTTYSFPRIAITTAGGDVRDAVVRESGTATETAMDIVTINESGIYMTRLGSGLVSDREVLFSV